MWLESRDPPPYPSPKPRGTCWTLVLITVDHLANRTCCDQGLFASTTCNTISLWWAQPTSFLFVFADGFGALESEKVCAWSQVEHSVSVFHMHDLGLGFLPGTPCSHVHEEAGSIDCFVPVPVRGLCSQQASVPFPTMPRTAATPKHMADHYCPISSWRKRQQNCRTCVTCKISCSFSLKQRSRAGFDLVLFVLFFSLWVRNVVLCCVTWPLQEDKEGKVTGRESCG